VQKRSSLCNKCLIWSRILLRNPLWLQFLMEFMLHELCSFIFQLVSYLYILYTRPSITFLLKNLFCIFFFNSFINIGYQHYKIWYCLKNYYFRENLYANIIHYCFPDICPLLLSWNSIHCYHLYFFLEYSPPIFIYTKLWKQRLKDVYLCHTSIYATLDKEISPQAKLEHYNNCVYEIKKKS
jgi:hypothetical protein